MRHPEPVTHDETLASVAPVVEQLLGDFRGKVTDEAVIRSVRMAMHAIRFFGDDPATTAHLVERIARNELDLLVDRRNERAWT